VVLFLRERDDFATICLQIFLTGAYTAMLSFFRKYQRFFFLVITVVIVISFSLFGTYNTLLKETSYHEQNAFTAIDGKKVSRTELDQMAIFLATDTHDKAVFSGAWGPNFLNDGVIVKNFLQTGLGTMLTYSHGWRRRSVMSTTLTRQQASSALKTPGITLLPRLKITYKSFAKSRKRNLPKPSVCAPTSI
jgi:hypothetical protein